MQGNRSKNTKPEIALRMALRAAGVTGYRLHYAKVPGRPDIAFVGRKIAVFLHGCYWHRCPKCGKGMPRNNAVYWAEKFRRNVERDRIHVRALKGAGWRVLVFWECDVRRDADKVVRRILRAVAHRA